MANIRQLSDLLLTEVEKAHRDVESAERALTEAKMRASALTRAVEVLDLTDRLSTGDRDGVAMVDSTHCNAEIESPTTHSDAIAFVGEVSSERRNFKSTPTLIEILLRAERPLSRNQIVEEFLMLGAEMKNPPNAINTTILRSKRKGTIIEPLDGFFWLTSRQKELDEFPLRQHEGVAMPRR